MNAYETALAQLDEIIRQLRHSGATDCALAEAQDAEAVRLNAWKHALRPDDERAFAEIARRYRETVRQPDR